MMLFCPVSLLSQCPQHLIDACVLSARTHTCLLMATKHKIPGVLKGAARGRLLTTPDSVLEIIQKHDGVCSRTNHILKLDNALKFRNRVCESLGVDNVTACALRCQIIENYAGEQLMEDIAQNHLDKITCSARANKVIDHSIVVSRTFQIGESCECVIEWGLSVQTISPIGALDTEHVRVCSQEMRVNSAQFLGRNREVWTPADRRELVPEWVCVVCFGLELESQQLLWLLSTAVLGDELTAHFKPHFGKKRRRTEMK